MNIRPIRADDEKELREIHEKYYKSEFTFEDFTSGFIASCIIESSQGGIISAGGLRPLTEVVLITNKDISIRDRREALYKMLHICVHSGNRLGIDSLHAFVQNEAWIQQLKRVGFKDTKGKALVLKIS